MAPHEAARREIAKAIEEEAGDPSGIADGRREHAVHGGDGEEEVHHDAEAVELGLVRRMRASPSHDRRIAPAAMTAPPIRRTRRRIRIATVEGHHRAGDQFREEGRGEGRQRRREEDAR